MRIIANIDGSKIVEDDDGSVSFTADADIDADGSPHAYSPADRGLDANINAKDSSGRWCGVACDRAGRPYLQLATDPCPGFYVSTTTLRIPGFADRDPRSYVDSETVPFIVVPPIVARAVKGIVLGCKARITYRGHSIEAVVADIGPSRRTGEISIAAAKLLGIPSSARRGGVSDRTVRYQLWPGVPAALARTYQLQPLHSSANQGARAETGEASHGVAPQSQAGQPAGDAAPKATVSTSPPAPPLG